MKVKHLLFCLATIFYLISCGGARQDKSDPSDTRTGDSPTYEIKILHAGSLAVPFKKMSQAFMEMYPSVAVLLESHGSRTCARHISELGKRVEVMGSADSAVIKNLLIPNFADFTIDFASNEMVIMYSESSRFSNEINANNWFDILLKPEVQFGHSDPNSDPCGYRAILTWKLAEKYYRQSNLYNRMHENMPAKNIRPKEVDLIALMEAGELDYVFIYRSVAEQHMKKYLTLPDEVNLKSKALWDWYDDVSLQITGKKPGEWIEVKGAPMVYGITIPKNATSPEWGARFIAFILGKEGRNIMQKCGQPLLDQPTVDHYEKLPALLKPFFDKGER